MWVVAYTRHILLYRRCRHKMQGKLLPSRMIVTGVDTGRSFSVLLFCIAMDPILTYLNKVPGVLTVQGYVDDTTMAGDTTLHYITLHYTTLHYISLHMFTLLYITLHYITPHYITLLYITLHYTTLYTLHNYITLHYTTLHDYITLHYVTLHYITLRYITLRYITLHYITLHYITLDTYIHIMWVCTVRGVVH